jgi:peptidoglycan hydrolase-like protein with peptidoglycan-binding domain
VECVALRPSRVIARIFRLPTMAGSTFLLIGIAIIGNALFMQPARHPAPMFAEPQPAPVTAQPDELVRAVQSALSEAGYYSGQVDGLAGPKTQAAIRAWEIAHGQSETGRATVELLVALLSSGGEQGSQTTGSLPDAPLPSTVEPDAPLPAAIAPDAQVAAIQRALSDAAYGPLVADGVFGTATRDAIVRFQKDRGLPETGEISDTLVVELRAAGALTEE